jgi:transmembrane sensor
VEEALMPHAQDQIDNAALDWAMRTGEPDFEDWEAFTDWLEADPRHGECYHLLQADATVLAERIPLAPTPFVPRAPLRRRWLAGALAASLAGVVAVGALQLRADPYVVETAAGTSRVVQLADGSSIALNGGTRLTLDHRNDRVATLESGEALFTVRHDPARPFKVKVGGDELVDVGTIFDVTRSDGRMWVGVAEGALIFNPRAEAVPVPAGRALTSVGGEVRVQDIAPGGIGAWRQGRLEFAGAPLSEVAEALSRALGTRFAVAPDIAARPFRGTIALADMKRDPTRLASLLGVRMQRTPQGWEIAPPL